MSSVACINSYDDFPLASLSPMQIDQLTDEVSEKADKYFAEVGQEVLEHHAVVDYLAKTMKRTRDEIAFAVRRSSHLEVFYDPESFFRRLVRVSSC